MKISIWKNDILRDASLDDLTVNFEEPTWINISDPSVEDLEKLAEALDIPRHVLIGKMRSNYPHVDSYLEYTKIFAWQLSPTPTKNYSFDKNPVIVFTNKVSTITISPSQSRIKEKIAEGLSAPTLNAISLTVRIIYLAMTHLLETYESLAEELERLVEKYEDINPPWSRHFYAEAFSIRKEASHLLRFLRHYRMLSESLAKGNTRIQLTEEETRLMDTVYDRAISAEETTETSLETIRDLISLHLDTLSHDMDKAMRLLASITAIVAIPSVIGSLLGTNLVGIPWPLQLWEVIVISTIAAALFTVYFYRKGWLKGT
jgi:magnesium transporter